MNIDSPEISVLLLFNLDPDWSAHEREEVLEITAQLEKAISSVYQTILAPVSNSGLNTIMARYNPLEYVVFNWCESLPGVAHSEWIVPEYLEVRGFAFTGASSETIALAQDKYRMKQLLDESGIPTPRWQIYDHPSPVRWRRFPAIVKPSREHCSEGIDRNAVVMTEGELKDRICYVLEKYKQPALVEDFIDGRELHVSLWGDGTIEMLPPAEMEFSLFTDQHDRICSYESKFVPESEPYQNIKTLLPAPLTEDELRRVEEICKATYMVTGCRDYARVDLRIRDGAFYILDVNPNPDISPDTSTVAAAEIAGYSYGDLGQRFVELAAKRHPVWGEPILAGNSEGATHRPNQSVWRDPV
ncbi:MAG: ATP-grasp domain-containing protein [Dehalococcoidia bacterium]|nr:ATP-grasp domain-containing protein [Dehalococcoidia bacterium]